MNNAMIEQIVVALAVGLATFGCFGWRSWWAAVLAAVLTWKFSDIAMIGMVCALGLFLIQRTMLARKSTVIGRKDGDSQ